MVETNCLIKCNQTNSLPKSQKSQKMEILEMSFPICCIFDIKREGVVKPTESSFK